MSTITEDSETTSTAGIILKCHSSQSICFKKLRYQFLAAFHSHQYYSLIFRYNNFTVTNVNSQNNIYVDHDNTYNDDLYWLLQNVIQLLRLHILLVHFLTISLFQVQQLKPPQALLKKLRHRLRMGQVISSYRIISKVHIDMINIGCFKAYIVDLQTAVRK